MPSTADDVYDEFQADVGGAAYADCRADLVALQRRILQDRAWFRSRLADADRFTVLGGPDRALEVVVVELYFAFWQYQHAAVACDDVPGPGATRRQVWTWVDVVFGWSFVSDRGVRPYTPYYFQAATQLGAPAPYEDEIADLLHHPGHDVAASFVPDFLDPLTFHPAAMADVDQLGADVGVPDAVRVRRVRPVERRAVLLRSGRRGPAVLPAVGPGRQPRGDDRRSCPDAARRAAIARVRQWAGVATTRAAILAAEQRSENAGAEVDQRVEQRTRCPRALTDWPACRRTLRSCGRSTSGPTGSSRRPTSWPRPRLRAAPTWRPTSTPATCC